MDSLSDEPPPPFLNFLPKTTSTSSFYEMPREPRLKLLVAANGPKEVAYAQAIAVRLSKEPKISIKVIVDDLTHRLTQEFPAYANRPLRPFASSYLSSSFSASSAPSALSSSSSSSSLSSSTTTTMADVENAQRRAFELVAWADLLVLAPIDADHLARMMAGTTDTLLLEVLRSWDASKRILLVPGMSTHMWENPVTKRQISKLHRKWQWVRVLPPILWHYNLPASVGGGHASSSSAAATASSTPTTTTPSTSLTSSSFAYAAASSSSASSSHSRKRVVEWSGFHELIGIIKNHADLLSLGHDVDIAAAGLNNGFAASPTVSASSSDAEDDDASSESESDFESESESESAGAKTKRSKSKSKTRAKSKHNHHKHKTRARLPPEIWSIILEMTGDWELAQALNVFTKLPLPTSQGWRRQPRDADDPLQVFMHELEWTLLTADTKLICDKLSQAPATIHDLSALAIKLIFKFSLTDVLTYIEAHCPLVFRNFDGKTVPTKASAYFGKTEILDWWVRSPSFLEKQYDAEALDGASKNGFVHVLEWWRRSGLPLKYTEAALEQASAKGHVRVLDWWREAASSPPPPPPASMSMPASLGDYNYDVNDFHNNNNSFGSSSAVSSASTAAAAAANAGFPVVLKPGRSLICAAQYGQADVIRWWEESGINAGHQDAICKVASRWGQVEVLELWRTLRGDDKIMFNHQVLVEPTMYSHIGVLDWWKNYAHGCLPGMRMHASADHQPHQPHRAGKQVEYRTMDIEEALEDALGDPTAVRRWWAENGLNLGLGTSEWMKARYL